MDALLSGRNIRSINVKNSQGKTALHFACAEGHDRVVEQLLKLGATVGRWVPCFCLLLMYQKTSVCLTSIEGNIIDDNRYFSCRHLKCFLPITKQLARSCYVGSVGHGRLKNRKNSVGQLLKDSLDGV